MIRFFKFLVRVSSFLDKEMTEIFRQPKLILTLVLGPFLIMLLFGLAYPNQNSHFENYVCGQRSWFFSARDDYIYQILRFENFRLCD